MDATTTPTKLPTTRQATLFAGEQEAEDVAEKQRQLDNKIDLLITPKNHQRLRAFGFEIRQAAELGPTTTDRRSL